VTTIIRNVKEYGGKLEIFSAASRYRTNPKLPSTV
jgi:hypothetical protein